ncbi:MAG: hypothetical protein ACRDMZ_13715, partial [Solirubrobacteraceae bacterium]
MTFFSARKAAPAEPQPDPQHEAGLVALRERLESLEAHCLTNLGAGLDAMTRGDLTVDVKPVTSPLEHCGDPQIDAIADVFNRMLEKAQAGLAGYNTVREDLRAKLGDHSILADLDVKMKSIDNNCLVALSKGLEGLRSGDLTIEAVPVTTSIEGRNGDAIGSLGDTFNSMLAKAQGGLGLYNETRAELATMIRQISTTSSSVNDASQRVAMTSDETGNAIGEIARAVGDVASGAERQVQMV